MFPVPVLRFCSSRATKYLTRGNEKRVCPRKARTQSYRIPRTTLTRVRSRAARAPFGAASFVRERGFSVFFMRAPAAD